jgi:hypothetical protein
MSWKRERFCGGKQKGRGGRFASSIVKQSENPRLRLARQGLEIEKTENVTTQQDSMYRALAKTPRHRSKDWPLQKQREEKPAREPARNDGTQGIRRKGSRVQGAGGGNKSVDFPMRLR